MSTYAVILDSEIDPDSPITTSLMFKLRDNPLAIQEGDASASSVRIQHAALAPDAGDWILLATASPASGTSNVDIISLMDNSKYGMYRFVWSNIASTVNTSNYLNMRISTDNGATFLSTNYGMQRLKSAAATTTSSAGSSTASWAFEFFNMVLGDCNADIYLSSIQEGSQNIWGWAKQVKPTTPELWIDGFEHTTATPPDAVRFYLGTSTGGTASGVFSTGELLVYGLRKV